VDQPVTFDIPGLAIVGVDTTDSQHPAVAIALHKNYEGDLRDFTPFSDKIWFACNEQTAINSRQLLEFVEVLSQWDTTGDDVPDYAHVVAAIEEALYLSTEAPNLFRRPSKDWYIRLVMRIMPPSPDFQIVLSFGDLKPRFRWYHHLAALPILGTVFGLFQLQVWLLPWMKYSVISGYIAAVSHLGLPSVVQMVIVGVGIGYLVSRTFGRRRKSKRQSETPASYSMHTIGFFNRMAVLEEQWFREGSQDWTLWQRTRSCLAFGLVHMTNLIYPLATVLPLSLGGALFMAVYLRTYRKTHFRRAAVLEAAIWHRVYNRMAFVAIAATIAWLVGPWALGAFAGVATASFLSQHVRTRRHIQALLVKPPETAVVE
jgi:hypothetical protein